MAMPLPRPRPCLRCEGGGECIIRWEEEWTLPPLRAKFPGAMMVGQEGVKLVGYQHVDFDLNWASH